MCCNKTRSPKEHNLSKAFALIIPSIIAASVLIAQIVQMVWNKFYIREIIANLPKNTNHEAAEKLIKLINDNAFNSLEYIVAVIGVAVSVWIGLNIYNILEKKDYENLRDSQEKRIQKLTDEQEEKFKIALADLQNGNLQLHLSSMLKVFAIDKSSEHYVNHFTSIPISDWNIGVIQTIIKVENVLSRVSSLTKANRFYSALEIVETVENEFIDSKAHFLSSNDNVVRGYYHYKMGEIFYYKANALFQLKSDSQRSIRLFNSAIEKYLQAYELDNRLTSIENGIGICHLRLVALGYEEHKEDAIRYLEIACEKEPNEPQFLRSLGSAYERIHDYDKAILYYQKEIDVDPQSYYARSCIASAYLKKIADILNISERSCPLCNISYELTNKQQVQLISYINLAIDEVETAIVINSSKIASYYRLGQIYTYQILISRINKFSDSDDEQLQKELEKKATLQFELCDRLEKKQKNAEYHRMIFCEVIGNIVEAKEINEYIHGKDYKRLKDLYDEYMDGKPNE